jgi:DNA-binding FadR family transcriptional regulator
MMEHVSTPTSSSALHSSVIEGWGRDIVYGNLAPGTRIVTDHMVESLGVSRTVVREAVRVLESMGLVQPLRRIGIVVLPPERWNPFDANVLRWRLAGPDRVATLRSLSELRAAVEPAAARLAARHATPQQCGDLTGAVIGMTVTARAANADAYLSHDTTFHRTLLEASGNPMYAGLTTVVTAVLSGRTRHALMPQVAEPEALRLHQVVAGAISSGDGAGAEEAMRGIVAESADAIETLSADGV